MHQRPLWLGIQGELKDKCIVKPALQAEESAPTSSGGAPTTRLQHDLHFWCRTSYTKSAHPV